LDLIERVERGTIDRRETRRSATTSGRNEGEKNNGGRETSSHWEVSIEEGKIDRKTHIDLWETKKKESTSFPRGREKSSL